MQLRSAGRGLPSLGVAGLPLNMPSPIRSLRVFWVVVAMAIADTLSRGLAGLRSRIGFVRMLPYIADTAPVRPPDGRLQQALAVLTTPVGDQARIQPLPTQDRTFSPGSDTPSYSALASLYSAVRTRRTRD
jgi:hypothetical protein